MGMRDSQELANIIENYLKCNRDIRYIDKVGMYFIADIFSIKEKIVVDLVIELLEFKKVIEFDGNVLLWKNNYYKVME